MKLRVGIFFAVTGICCISARTVDGKSGKERNDQSGKEQSERSILFRPQPVFIRRLLEATPSPESPTPTTETKPESFTDAQIALGVVGVMAVIAIAATLQHEMRARRRQRNIDSYTGLRESEESQADAEVLAQSRQPRADYVPYQGQSRILNENPLNLPPAIVQIQAPITVHKPPTERVPLKENQAETAEPTAEKGEPPQSEVETQFNVPQQQEPTTENLIHLTESTLSQEQPGVHVVPHMEMLSPQQPQYDFEKSKLELIPVQEETAEITDEGQADLETELWENEQNELKTEIITEPDLMHTPTETTETDLTQTAKSELFQTERAESELLQTEEAEREFFQTGREELKFQDDYLTDLLPTERAEREQVQMDRTELTTEPLKSTGSVKNGEETQES